MTTGDQKPEAKGRAVAKLLLIAETLATQECEMVEAGQQPCPVQSDRQDDWCLVCLAKKAVAEYVDA